MGNGTRSGPSTLNNSVSALDLLRSNTTGNAVTYKAANLFLYHILGNFFLKLRENSIENHFVVAIDNEPMHH